jgi:hypothetical protein
MILDFVFFRCLRIFFQHDLVYLGYGLHQNLILRAILLDLLALFLPLLLKINLFLVFLLDFFIKIRIFFGIYLDFLGKFLISFFFLFSNIFYFVPFFII